MRKLTEASYGVKVSAFTLVERLIYALTKMLFLESEGHRHVADQQIMLVRPIVNLMMELTVNITDSVSKPLISVDYEASYASILYLRIPSSFQIILRGKDVEHHNVVNDMMMAQEITYRPQPGTDGIPKDSNMVAVVTIGFVKDAKAHIDVQGFNVYHKNRLIKPFWRLWNATGSDGRGVIGVLEANFVEPAHDKQGFERTTVLSRLEGRLIQMQKTYWRTYCHKIGYAPRRNKKHINEGDTSPDYLPQTSPRSKNKKLGSSSKIPISGSDKLHSPLNPKQGRRESERHTKLMDEALGNERMYNKGGNRANNPVKSGKEPNSSEPSTPSEENVSDDEMQTALPERKANGNSQKVLPANRSFGKDGSHVTRSSMNLGNVNAEQDCASHGRPVRITCSQSKGGAVSGNECSFSISNSNTAVQLKEENQQLRERLKRKDGEILGDLLHDIQLERDRCKSLETKASALKEATQKIEELNKEQESLIDIFSEERERRDIEEEKLRKQLKDASNTIQQLLDKVRMLEKMKSPSSKLVR
ncbi:hypothetical protein TEA_030099 [Camellia sinensis var. sinensis]|uniref:Morc S5 domain-containing protein n=1 Tax=Camellia sinensis var. sinensis TaxID=542762 RepID=A0A4S4DT56_CAMSN|nr:hypothetical protein TEA_030099 [Camellia sinensis var. sinensis]